MDYFHEESVTKVNAGLNSIIYVICYIGMVIFVLFALQGLITIMNGIINIPVIAITLVCGALAYGCFVLKNNQRIEYDYTFTNGILDIAKITNNSKRKKLLSVDVREFEVIAPISDEGFKRMLHHKGIQNRYNYFLNRGPGLYYGIFTQDGVKSMLVFEPSDKLVELFKIFNPRNVKTR
ncbi:hypothetical protein KVG29_09700 [Caldicoprobacter algeriensis]|uniref:DUF6106 family protein n=1 Tax=Caldicoprobacter algeriensis TaxID=699281 RepID=UPI002079BBAF|nr:DUF6106 family protein [Caldicoprobacter algeriensis]MCM8901492.1 hypothetical protein [Caldicoprobacter algeriensis]